MSNDLRGYSQNIKNNKIERNTKFITNYLDKINVHYTENNGTLIIPWKEKVYYVGLHSGKLRVQGKNIWYKFSKVFFE